MFESYRDLSVETPYGGRMGFDQRQLDRQTMGNVESLYTHEPLRQEPPTKDWKWDGKCTPARRDWQSDAIAQRQDDQRRNGQLATGFGWSQMFEGTGFGSGIAASRRPPIRSGSWRWERSSSPTTRACRIP
jgi:hypothetical protein